MAAGAFEGWVALVCSLLPDAASDSIREDLMRTGDPQQTINNFLDGQLTPAVSGPVAASLSLRLGLRPTQSVPPSSGVSGSDHLPESLTASTGSLNPEIIEELNVSATCARAPKAQAKARVRSAWGSLRPATAADLKGPVKKRARRNEPPPFTHLVVLDFEWTADDKRPILPVSEITQFPSVLVALDGCRSAAVSEFDTFVRPVLNPKLTPFAIGLTAITQADVDAAPTLDQALPLYLRWLEQHNLVEPGGGGVPIGSWAIATWSDADIGGQLAKELRHKNIAMPKCFEKVGSARRARDSSGRRPLPERVGDRPRTYGRTDPARTWWTF